MSDHKGEYNMGKISKGGNGLPQTAVRFFPLIFAKLATDALQRFRTVYDE
jgi:hypothetical protein